jgi:hypothetical protein
LWGWVDDDIAADFDTRRSWYTASEAAKEIIISFAAQHFV